MTQLATLFGDGGIYIGSGVLVIILLIIIFLLFFR